MFGANDNTSGCAAILEAARTRRTLVDEVRCPGRDGRSGFSGSGFLRDVSYVGAIASRSPELFATSTSTWWTQAGKDGAFPASCGRRTAIRISSTMSWKTFTACRRGDPQLRDEPDGSGHNRGSVAPRKRGSDVLLRRNRFRGIRSYGLKRLGRRRSGDRMNTWRIVVPHERGPARQDRSGPR
jgi:hypothetical protein